MDKVRSFLAIAIVGLVLFAGGVSDVSAQNANKPEAGNGLKIAPVRTDLTIEKGSSRPVTLSVENITASPVTVRGVVNDFVPSADESGEPRIILDEKQSAPGNSFKTLVSPILGLTLQPNERREIRVSIAVPAKAASGGYYGAIRFAPGGGENDKNVALTASVGTIFLVRVPGNITEKLSVEGFQVSHGGKSGSLFNSGPVTIVTRFRNFGNIHVQPFGKIYVKDMKGKTIADIEINNAQPRGSVLPASIRKFENPVPEKSLFGRYVAEGNFGYGTNGELITAKKTFYVIPYKLIGAILAILAFLIFILPRLIRKYNENIIKQSKRRR
jgi:hypothetical protein